jgi:hypothetical protein
MKGRCLVGIAAAVLLLLVPAGCGSPTRTVTTTVVTQAPTTDTAPPDTASKDTNTGTTDTTPTATTSSNGCPFTRCVGDWDTHQNGYIVQCRDGVWSHSGGVSGACSYHGGETNTCGSDSGQVVNCANSSPTPSPAPATTTASPTTGCNCGVADLPVRCDPNISGSAGIHCSFAENTFYEYYKASGGDPTQSPSLQVWSPTYKVYVGLQCSNGDGVVDCRGSDPTSTIDVRFTQASMSAYTADQAASYARSADLGPNG